MVASLAAALQQFDGVAGRLTGIDEEDHLRRRTPSIGGVVGTLLDGA